MKLNTIFMLLIVSLYCATIASCKTNQNRKGEGLVLQSSFLYSGPDSSGAEKSRVIRGEAVRILQEKIENENETKEWSEILLSDNETKGWIKKKFLHPGPKLPITITEKTVLHVRPDEQSPKTKSLLAGTSMFILKQKDGWMKVSIDFNLDGWIKTDKFITGVKKEE